MPAKPRKKKELTLSKEAALTLVRRLMQSTGFDEEEQEGDRIHFGSREGGDMEEDRADPALVRFARTKAKEIEAAVPGSKVRVEPVDEWVTIDVTLPTAGRSFKGTAIVTWDHGKSVEARTLDGERIRLERAQDGSLRRFT